MLEIKGKNIYLTRGDSAYITITIRNQSGELYEVQDSDELRLQVRTSPNTGKLVFEGRLIKESKTSFVWYIRPEDTSECKISDLYYDCQLTLSNGDVFTVIPCSKFVLKDEVTLSKKVVN